MVVATAEMMRGPPLAPTTASRRPSGVVSIMGDMLDRGRLPGRMKLAALGCSLYVLAMSGREKSSIWLLYSTPAAPECEGQNVPWLSETLIQRAAAPCCPDLVSWCCYEHASLCEV